MKLKSKIAVGAALIVALTLGGVVPANAASQSGSQGCGSGTRVAYLDTDTNGNTRHSWTNTSNGNQRQSTFANGGLNRSWGYQNSTWVVTASTITSARSSCG